MARGPRVVQLRPGWQGQLRSTGQGAVIKDLANVLIALRQAPGLADSFGFDEMLQETVVRERPPFAPGCEESEPYPHRLTDDDVSRLQEWLQWNGLPKIGRDIVGQAVEERSREFRFHPVREWLETLEWDGVPRINTWLKDFMGAAGSDNYLAAIGSMFLIAMVARIFQPGCKCDYMLVLEGEQGKQKSLACKILAGGETYFSDDLGDIAQKDAKQHVIGKWVIEESDLAHFTKATTETLKAFLSRTSEKFRPPYGKGQIVAERQCVFVGTTNRGDYNKDETGARRLWPVNVVNRINLKALEENRTQLFAEAVARYNQGEQWWPDPDFEIEVIKPEQAERRAVDAWQQSIEEYLTAKVDQKVSVMEVALHALDMKKVDVGTAAQNRIKACMSLIGWRKIKKRQNSGYFWEFIGDV